MVLQPILGYLHHAHFVRHRRRGIVSYLHRFYGRALIIIGIVNGGLGLQLARAPGAAVISYSVVAGAVALIYIVVVMVAEERRLRGKDAFGARAGGNSGAAGGITSTAPFMAATGGQTATAENNTKAEAGTRSRPQSSRTYNRPTATVM